MRYCKQSPNEAPPGQIHELALIQLAEWQRLADEWPRYPDGRCVRCGSCQQSMLMEYDTEGKPYVMTDDQRLALIVAHIRQRHPEDINATD